MQQFQPSNKPISAGLAVLIGQLIVNIPVFLIIIGGVVLAIFIFTLGSFILSMALIFLSPLVAWLWWSFMIPRWRRWAHRQGADPDKLQELSVITGLVWPKGVILEKTEFKLKDDQ